MKWKLPFVLLLLLTMGRLSAQVVLYTEGFETDGEGTRYTTNTFVDCVNSDFFLRTNTNPVSPTTCGQLFVSAFTNLQGSFFWASEDIRTSTPVPLSRPPGDILTQNISVSGYSSLTVSLFLATSGNNNARWESADSINIKASFDAGPFRTVGRFMGKGTPTVGARLGIDSNLDGAITGADPITNCDTVLFTKYTFSIPNTGTNLRIEIDFDQVGGSEELAIDHIEVSGTAVPCTAPVITCPATQSLALNATCSATLPDYTGLATVTGNCSPTTTQNPTAGTIVSGSGAISVTLTATNTALQTASCNFTVNKTTPEAEVRGNTNVIADGDLTPSTTDLTDFTSVLTCTGTVSRTYTIHNLTGAFGRTMNVGTVTVGGTNAADFTVSAQPASTVTVGGSTTFTVVFNPSANGLRTATLSFSTDDCDENPYNFSIQGTGNADVSPPTITCPGTQTLALGNNCTALVPDYTPLLTVSDNCPGSPTLGQTPPVGTGIIGMGTFNVTLTATDGSGNANTCIFFVNTTEFIPPTITCPANMVVPTDPGLCSAVVTYNTPVGTDNCAGATTNQLVGLPSGGTFPVGTTNNSFRVTDLAGNSASCSFTVTVQDQELPVVTCPPSGSVNNAPGSCSGTLTFPPATATDNCTTVTVTQTAGPASGSSVPVGSSNIVYQATDANGNTATCTFTMDVLDTELPTITCPPNMVVASSPTTCDAVVNYAMPSGADNCTISQVIVGTGLPSGSTFVVGTLNLVLEAVDVSNNIGTCGFTITVVDSTAPTAGCQGSVDVLLDANGNGTLTANQVDNGSSDNCSVASTSLDVTSFTCNEVGTQSAILTVTDAAGNSSTCATIVNVIDNLAPTATCQSATVTLDLTGNASITANDIDGGSTDNCGIASTSANPTTFTIGNAGANNVVLTVTDVNGNTATCTAVVTVDTLVGMHDPILPGIGMEAAPNPFQDLLTVRVSCDGCEVGGLLTVEVWNISGQRLLQQTLAADQGMRILQLPMDKYAAGTYLISLTDGKAFISRRVVKQ